uniref:Glycoside hydrolase family 5 domain-containing protein n=1 Tax=Globisporangium ultimum (strain ATCC 200006 / CBS 805.95 / DAOM BR144) TaxID=431595 RepID=K3WW72_GLOUD
MAFGFTKTIETVALLVWCALLLPYAQAWTAPIIAKGNKFFYSDTGNEFRLKGMAYYPRPNAGEMASVSNYDWTADEHEDVWMDHLDVMQDLGVNTIRLYSIDPSKSHDKFMCACSNRGIYVLVGFTAPCANCSIIDELPSKCYSDSLFTRAQMVYNAMAVYDNTLGFSVGNENNLQMLHGAKGVTTAPCVKVFLRDTRNYASSCAGSLRQVPIGLDIADIPPREQWLRYYDCEINNDEHTRADYCSPPLVSLLYLVFRLGFNPYVECNPRSHTEYKHSTGLQNLMAEYAATSYSRPIMFGEFGCNEGENTIDGYENQRSFYDARWMNEETEMTNEIVGGNVFEFTTEVMNLQKTKKLTRSKDPGKFGVGYFAPDDCNHSKKKCTFMPYPEYENLKAAYTKTRASKVTLQSFEPTRKKVLTCPKGVSTALPGTPRGT